MCRRLPPWTRHLCAVMAHACHERCPTGCEIPGGHTDRMHLPGAGHSRTFPPEAGVVHGNPRSTRSRARFRHVDGRRRVPSSQRERVWCWLYLFVPIPRHPYSAWSMARFLDRLHSNHFSVQHADLCAVPCGRCASPQTGDGIETLGTMNRIPYARRHPCDQSMHRPDRMESQCAPSGFGSTGHGPAAASPAGPRTGHLPPCSTLRSAGLAGHRWPPAAPTRPPLLRHPRCRCAQCGFEREAFAAAGRSAAPSWPD